MFLRMEIMHMNDIVSVIIPVYNNEKYVKECITSIMNQSYKYLEIIVVDDGSLDNSADICDETAKFDERITVYHNDNMGVGAARNFGIEKASGKYVMFVDSDDICHENMIEKMTAELEKKEEDLIICGIAMFKDYPQVNRYIRFDSQRLSIQKYIEKVLLSVQTGQFCGGPYNKIFSRKIIVENGLRFETKMNYAEDFCFNLSYLQYIDSVQIIDECLYYYRMDVQNSLTYKNYHEFKEQEYWKQRFMAYKRFEETFVYYDLFYKNKEQVELLLKKYLISTMKMCCKNKLPKEKIITFIGEINSDPYIQSRINNGKFMSFSDKFRMNLMRNDKLIILYYLEKTRYLIGNLLLIIMKSK